MTSFIEIVKYSGNLLMSTPRDREKVLILSEVDLIRIQRHIVYIPKSLTVL